MAAAKTSAEISPTMLLTRPKRGVNAYRTLFFMPSLAPTVGASLMFVYLFNPTTGKDQLVTLRSMFGSIPAPTLRLRVGERTLRLLYDSTESGLRLGLLVAVGAIFLLLARLGHPTLDPHGDPIPTLDGIMPDARGICLADMPIGAA